MADRVGPIPFIFNLIQEGINATKGLELYREGGGQIRTQRFYQAYGEVSAELAVLPELQALAPGETPSGDLVRKVSSLSSNKYNARVGVLVSVRTVDPLTGKVTESTMTNWGSVAMNELASVAEILAAGEENFGPSGQSGLQNSTVLGSILGPIIENVPTTD